MTVDLKKAKEDALAEVEKERLEAAKTRYKAKLQELDRARKVVRNIEREIVDLDDELRND